MTGKNILLTTVIQNDLKNHLIPTKIFFLQKRKTKIIINKKYYLILKNSKLFSNIFCEIVSESSFLRSIILESTCFTNIGSFSCFPLSGVGVRYGLSVSMIIFLSEMFFAAS
jgi:hypothetical protein